MEMVGILLMVTSMTMQSFTLQVGPPVAGNAPVAKNSVFVVRPGGCPDAASAHIVATAEGVVNGARQSVPLKVNALPAPGVRSVTKQWPDAGGWIVHVVGTCAGQTAGALVTLGPKNRYRRDGVRLVPHEPTKQEIDASLKALTGGQ